MGTMNRLVLVLVLLLETNPSDRGRGRERRRGGKVGSWKFRHFQPRQFGVPASAGPNGSSRLKAELQTNPGSPNSNSKLLGGLLGHEILSLIGASTSFVLRHLRVADQ